MRSHTWALFATVCSAAASALASTVVVPEQDYYSWQVSSASTPEKLQAVYQEYAELPYVRLERSGSLYVVRVGFWKDRQTAEASGIGKRIPGALLRVASLQPKLLLQHNWKLAPDDHSESVASTPVTPSHAAAAPAPTAPTTAPQTPATATVSNASAAAARTPRDDAGNGRVFNAEDHLLAFDILVKAGDTKSAFQVAQQAVAALPQDRAWRLRLIQVATWVSRSDIAADQWLTLFKQGDHSSETLSKAIELAPLTDQPLVALQAWAVYTEKHTLTDAQWNDIYTLYENAAEPKRGSLFFEGQYRINRKPMLLEMAARQAENSGDDDRADQLFIEHAALSPFSLNSVLRAVVRLLRRDRLPQALALLKEHEPSVPENASEFWGLLGQVAWALGDQDASRAGYQRFIHQPPATASDWGRLIYLLRPNHPEQAADLSIEAYRKFGNIDQLLEALGIYSELGNITAQGRVLASLGHDKSEELANKHIRFLLLRIQYYQKTKALDKAWADIRRALKMAPRNVDVVASALWYLTDTARIEELKVFIRDHKSFALEQSRLWSGFAAANQLLEQHREAVRWYETIIKAKADDPLMLLNYADALHRINRAGMADRVRRHAWLQLKERHPNPADALRPHENSELLAFSRLTMMNQASDPGMALVRQLVAQLRGVPNHQELDRQTLALVLGWSIVKEQFHNARSWIWRRYSSQIEADAPLWGDSQSALQVKESPVMDRLLTRHGEALPVYNRYDIAYDLGHAQQALDVAFKGMEPQDDEPLYDRFRQHAPLHAHYAQVEAVAERSADYAGNHLHFEARLVINPRLHVLLGATQQAQTGSGVVLGDLTPDFDQLASLEARWLGPRAQYSLAVFARDSSQSLYGLRLGHTYQWTGHSSLEANLSLRAESTLSLPLRVAGYENTIGGAANFTLGKREYIRIAPRYSQYYTQWGDPLGTGQFLDVEAGYRFRIDYPDWRVSTYARWQDFSRETGLSSTAMLHLPPTLRNTIDAYGVDAVGLFVPESSLTWGTCLSMGENLGGQNMQLIYTKAWRYFLNFCASADTVRGASMSGTVGLVGSIFGEDHVKLQLQSGGSVSPGTASTNTISLRYRHYF